MKTAADPFKRACTGAGLEAAGRDGRSRQLSGADRGAGGPDHASRARGATRAWSIEYVEGWLSGRGAKGIDSLAGKPGVHPALMEDLATGRMSVAQIAQRIRHRANDHAGPVAVHDVAAGQAAARRKRSTTSCA